MANKIRLDIVTPERMVYSEDVNMVIARATDGDLGVLPGHVPLIAGLDIWPLRILQDEGEAQVAVCGGFIEVRPQKITILAGCAELPGEIDIERAEAAKERAEARLKSQGPDIDVLRAESALRRAIVRLKVGSSK
ncbi:MAG TPA: F0F1 ATP synthase subunit epsilon [Methylomusa anaerophila]|uniref:ATP synthase epsilon chain n=1 Tax=Methylomusa anaerophila TaxID=1930071 RepID=A0A348AKD3_9FIRM|nr:F0F1 ATP synthase subunit epsilon [Methylomusa anaerophila]BBB91531.1 ATP synthase epsilon chain [Methylomusa anaerophila]HML89531.1 F0F1 ATP synthase subunit epsilon [Methylomusa anaerophila]